MVDRMKYDEKLSWVAYFFSIFLVIAAVNLAYARHDIVIDSAALIPLTLIGFLFVLIYAIEPLLALKSNPVSLHMSSFIMVNLVILSVSFYKFPEFFIMIPALAIYIIHYYVRVSRFSGIVVRIPTFFATILLMTFLGDIVTHIIQPPGFPVTVETTSTMFAILGLKIPLLETYGIFVISPVASFVTSPVEYLLFFSIAALVSENYHEIISYVTGSSDVTGKLSTAVYGLTGAFSCQCESFIALLPAVSILLINYILAPMIFVSAALLAGTYILVVRFYKQGRRNLLFEPERWNHAKTGRIALVSAVIIGVPIFFTVGVYYSWQRHALFFFLTNMLMILAGYVSVISIFRIIRAPNIGMFLMTLLSIVGVALPVLWFIPFLTVLAYSVPVYFGLMTLSAFAGGILLGFAYSSLGEHEKLVFNEYITVVFGLLPLVVFYITDTLQRRIWPVFSLTGQTEFSIIGWLAMLPVMWYATHMSLNRMAAPYRQIAEMNDNTLPSIVT